MKFAEHVRRRNELCVVFPNSLQAFDVPDRANRCAPDFANPLRNIVSYLKTLIPMLIEQEMKIPKMRTAHVPMTILRFQIQREDVGEQCIDSSGYISDCFLVNV